MSNNNGKKLAGKVAVVTGGSRGTAAMDLRAAGATMVRNRRSARCRFRSPRI
jgi:NAD(P)-dependent dehydrogenase (short-subunit alcohol dehydrogenase family)